MKSKRSSAITSQLFKSYRVLWMPFEVAWSAEPSRAHCCTDMTNALAFECEQHADPFECGDCALIYNLLFDEYGLVVHDGGASYLLINHCPWCAAKLPESQRDRWFDETDALNLEGDAALPKRYLTDEWRKNA